MRLGRAAGGNHSCKRNGNNHNGLERGGVASHVLHAVQNRARLKVTGRLRTSFLIVINEAETGGSAAISPSRII